MGNSTSTTVAWEYNNGRASMERKPPGDTQRPLFVDNRWNFKTQMEDHRRQLRQRATR